MAHRLADADRAQLGPLGIFPEADGTQVLVAEQRRNARVDLVAQHRCEGSRASSSHDLSGLTIVIIRAGRNDDDDDTSTATLLYPATAS